MPVVYTCVKQLTAYGLAGSDDMERTDKSNDYYNHNDSGEMTE